MNRFLGSLLLCVGMLGAGARADATPPPVQMLAPGFRVRELPVKITNPNVIRYGPDGKLYLAGYDGRIHVLTDTDGDGLEDKIEPYWDKGGIRTPMAMLVTDHGLLVVSNGKISRLLDTDNDGKADKEEVITTGWVPDDGMTGGGVDAVGLAQDKGGNLYIGLGVANYANAYRLVDDKPHYDLKSERGTILKVAPDGKREILCTGIRFPLGIAFNRAGDLFCTDQEGETWMPNGNPLDELNHIRPGLHYGFPPRSDKYLPNVIDEPPVVGFDPQHQSTCGLIFNESKPNQPAWGPKAWEGEALVAGFGRGKLWRVRLLKTPAGYVGKQTLVAQLRLLTLESAISPTGDLLVACHSGPPDWGTGPAGTGHLFKISYVDPQAPQPVIAWAASATEVRLAFDKPLDAAALDLDKARIDYGTFVKAGDQFEILKPPYAAVDRQERTPRGQLRIVSSKLIDDGRTISLTTDPHPLQTNYAVTIPFKGQQPDGQQNVVALDYDLSGVEAMYGLSADSTDVWEGWLPSPELDVSRALCEGSAEHEKVFKSLTKSGVLFVGVNIRSHADQATLQVTGAKVVGEMSREGEKLGIHNLEMYPGRERVPFDIPAHVGEKGASFFIGILGDGDMALPHVARLPDAHSNGGPLPLNWAYPDWVPTKLPDPPPPPKLDPKWAGGDAKRGAEVFASKEANCIACHTFRGKGGKIGPDLSNSPQRDLAGIVRDIIDPNAAINPDHVAYMAKLKDNRTLVGVVKSDGQDRIRLADATGAETVIPRDQIVRLQASPISIMPTGLDKTLGPDRLRDLLAYLTTEDIAAQGENHAPPPRRRREVEEVLRHSQQPGDEKKLRPLNILLIAGPKDHGPGEHDYPAWQKSWEPLLAKLPAVKVTTAFGKPTADQWEQANLVIMFSWGPQFWEDDFYAPVDKFLARGGGLALLHSAVIPAKPETANELAKRIGLAYPTNIKFRHGAMDLAIDTSSQSPIVAGLGTVHFVDESYWPHVGDMANVKVLATTIEEGQPRPMVWTREQGKGRVFATILGHYTWTFDDPMGRIIFLRGMAWAAGEPTGRFDRLATEGVELAE